MESYHTLIDTLKTSYFGGERCVDRIEEELNNIKKYYFDNRLDIFRAGQIIDNSSIYPEPLEWVSWEDNFNSNIPLASSLLVDDPFLYALRATEIFLPDFRWLNIIGCDREEYLYSKLDRAFKCYERLQPYIESGQARIFPFSGYSDDLIYESTSYRPNICAKSLYLIYKDQVSINIDDKYNPPFFEIKNNLTGDSHEYSFDHPNDTRNLLNRYSIPAGTFLERYYFKHFAFRYQRMQAASLLRGGNDKCIILDNDFFDGYLDYLEGESLAFTRTKVIPDLRVLNANDLLAVKEYNPGIMFVDSLTASVKEAIKSGVSVKERNEFIYSEISKHLQPINNIVSRSATLRELPLATASVAFGVSSMIPWVPGTPILGGISTTLAAISLARSLKSLSDCKEEARKISEGRYCINPKLKVKYKKRE